MKEKTSFHSICAWTFNAGGGGFTPGNVRPSWAGDSFGTVEKIRLIRDRIVPRMPGHVALGMEMHYDNEFNEESAGAVADALQDGGLFLAMATPGAHRHWAYGGVASLDAAERHAAEAFGRKTVELTCGAMRRAWHPAPDKAPTLVLWNGSYGYDLATLGVRGMYRNLKESVADLCSYEKSLGGSLYWAIEPKPNEGHPAMLLPTVASVIVFWRRLAEEFGVDMAKKGVNKEFGHSEMIGLDTVYDTVEEIDNDMLVHMHVNSQGWSDGILLGGPGKFDVDNGVRVNGVNIAVAGLMAQAGYTRWKGHDMQPRPYDNEDQAVERVVRSILSWEACEAAAAQLDDEALLGHLADRDTACAEDMMREAVVHAQQVFDTLLRAQ